ncbi:MAG: PIN domain-containing protein [Anaerolineales bacterium]|jgi:predicted nucleic acid-binding protein|nr:PIN domain-containing protein [Anaerolineales bacterium]
MKIYLDACCLNRPFDDQRQARVRLEAEAISLILQKLHQRDWEWIGSDVLAYELGQTEDVERKERLLLLAGQSHQVVEMTEKILTQAEKLESSGFDSYDAIHLASAEHAKVDIFLTTDDNMQKIANRNKKLFSFVVVNPVTWLEEVLK